MKTILFDFDKTLTTKDTTRPLAHYLTKKSKRFDKLAFFYLLLILYKLKCLPDRRLKQGFLKLFVKKANTAAVDKLVCLFHENKLKCLLNAPILEKLQNHVKAQDKVYIVSANFDFFLQPLVNKWNLAGLICTQTEKKDNCFTGKLLNQTCKGKNKLDMVTACFGRENLKNITAYADFEDACLLQNVGKGVKIS